METVVTISTAFFYGSLAFIFAGIDDFFTMLFFRVKYPKNFRSVISGTLLGLFIVLGLSTLCPLILVKTGLINYLDPKKIIGAILLFMASKMLYDSFKNDLESEEIDSKLLANSTFTVIIAAMTTFIANGLDNLTLYTVFFLKYNTLLQMFAFIFGNIFSLLMFSFIITFIGKHYDKINEKLQDKIIKTISVCVILVGIYFLIS